MAPPIKKPGAAAAGKTVLANKERALFAKLIQEYESKKYKTGLKTADQILKKFPEHGETLCMKGLILASLNRRQEGLDLAKQGLRFDLTSFISWHALGILNRMIKNYTESIKCYAQALKIEGGTNINLVRESAYLYIQLRDWAKVVEHRSTLLRMQPHLRMNWVGLAVALHLGGNHDDTLRVLEKFESVHRDVPKRSFEQSEVFLYHAQVLFDAQRYDDVIEYLAAKQPNQILDAKARELLNGKSYLALNRNQEAEKVFIGLLKRNEEDRQYVIHWLKSKGVDVSITPASSPPSSSPSSSSAQLAATDRKSATAALKQLQEQFPKSRAIQRLILTFAAQDEFKQDATVYIINAIQKGVPSIFNDVRSLYVDDEKRVAVEGIVEEAHAQWSAATSDQPSSLLWATAFLAQHFAHLGQYQRALDYIHKAIAHTPTLPELHMIRARTYKRAGALQWAAVAMEDARLLDGQDRSLNCKAAKYLLRSGDVEGASAKAGLFTKPDVADPVADLVEMQATWYLIEDAKAWYSRDNIAMALKRLTQIDRIFTEIWDDQLDFHSYTTRKFTLRAYVDMVHFEDRLYTNHVYFKTASMAIGICLTLHDNPSLYKPQNGATNGAAKTEEEKKEAKKAKKQEQRAAAEEAAKKKTAAADATKNEEDAESAGPAKDDDPEGTEALKTLDPLQEAERYITTLQREAPSSIETWLLTFEVALRQRNWLIAVKAAARAYQLDANNADLHVALVQLRLALPSLSEAPEPIGKSIEAVLGPIVPAVDQLEAFRADFVQRNAQSAEVQVAGARSLRLLRRDGSGKEASDLLVNIAQQVANGQIKAALPTLEKAFSLVDTDAKPAFLSASHAAYPLADAFKSDEQKKQESVDRENERRDWAFAPPVDEGKANGK